MATSLDTALSTQAVFISQQLDAYQIFEFDHVLSQTELNAVKAIHGVAGIDTDAFITPDMTPNDPLFLQAYQTDLQTPINGWGTGVQGAWDISTGSPSVSIAVLDTGMTDHPDLAGRWSGGYDFVSSAALSGDGDGWDSDPHNTAYNASIKGGTAWHGTHVAGTIGAVGNNGTGVSGINWQSPIESVRVLGWAGGYLSDVAAGILWAAGETVTGAPKNPHPARVINLSLGASAPCDALTQNAIDKATADGTIVVVAAGNSNSNTANFEPAGCNHVIAVASNSNPPNPGKSDKSNFRHGSKRLENDTQHLYKLCYPSLSG